jgi:hypothetical protein
MKSLDKISSLCLLFFAIGISIQSYKLSLGTMAEPGPGFFPMGSGITLGALSLLIFTKAILTSENRPNPFWPDKKAVRKIILVVLTILLYAISLEYLGFLLCTFLSMLFLLKVIEPQKWFPAIFFAVITSLSSYTVFEIFLKSQLPKGLIMGP